MKGSASRPSSATMNGTRCAIRPATNATSRESRSSFDTTTQHLALLAAARAAASCGRRSSASAPLPVSALDVLGDDLDILGFGEPGDRRALRLDPEPRALLLPSRDTIIGNSAIHTKCIPPFAL